MRRKILKLGHSKNELGHLKNKPDPKHSLIVKIATVKNAAPRSDPKQEKRGDEATIVGQLELC